VAAIVVLTGGGIKGAVAAGRYAKDHEVILLHADHGQESASAETRALAVLAAFWPKARLLSVALPEIDHVPSARTVPAPSPGAPGPVASPTTSAVLTIRGLTPALLSVGARAALRYGASSVVAGVSAFAPGDHIGLPGPDAASDARREVLHAFGIMLDALLRPRTRIRIEAPLMDLTYAEVIKLGQRLSIPFERTWTCTQRGPMHCGRCATCKARENAFAEAAVLDPVAAATNSIIGAMPKPAVTAARA